MYTTIIEYGTPAYVETVALRHDLLRKPIGLNFTKEQLELEWLDFHMVCYDGSGILLACLVLTPRSKNIVQMRQLAVTEKLHGQGIGRFLVKACERWAIENGYDKMILHAREPIIPFYLKQDYSKVGKRFKEVNIPHFKMEKNLKVK